MSAMKFGHLEGEYHNPQGLEDLQSPWLLTTYPKPWEPILQFKSQKTKLKPENPPRNEEENHLKLTIPSFLGGSK